MTTTLLTTTDRQRLLANGELHRRRQREDPDTSIDFVPVVKLFTPDAGCTWLLTELDPAEPDFAFGLCDLGLGCPELGYVSLSELTAVRGHLGLPVERELYFTPEDLALACQHSVRWRDPPRRCWCVSRAPNPRSAAYAEEARLNGRIVA